MILITAPHTIKTIRFKNFIPELHKKEPFLFQIGRELETLNQVQGLDVKFLPNFKYRIDPNFHKFSGYRKKILMNQEFNFDLHGMSDIHGVDLEIGTSEINYNLEDLETFLTNNKISYAINNKFKAPKRTITYMLSHEYGIKAIQIEISRKLRLNYLETSSILKKFIKTFTENNPY